MKNVDLLFIQYLTSTVNQAKILDFKRLGINDEEWSDDTLVKIINKFFNDTDTRRTPDVVPDEVLNIISELRSSDDIGNINKLTAALRTHGFEFLIVDRFDLSKSEFDPIDEDATMFGYIWNVKRMDSKINCCVSGCARNYYANNFQSASAGDFLSLFNLSQNDLILNGLTASKASYEVLKEKNKLDIFDDSSVKVFLNARDWTYCTIYVA